MQRNETKQNEMQQDETKWNKMEWNLNKIEICNLQNGNMLMICKIEICNLRFLFCKSSEYIHFANYR